MFCMIVIIVILSVQCKSFFLIPKKIMDFFSNQEIFLEKTTVLLFFCTYFFVMFSHIFSEKSFSQKKYPLSYNRGYAIKFDSPERCFLPHGSAAGTEKAIYPFFPEIFWRNN